MQDKTRDVWVTWILENIKPVSMVTLTYEDEVHPQQAKQNLMALIHVLNKSMLGENYRDKVKHSYFSYVFVKEYQRRGVLHWHGIVDNWVDYTLIHNWWPAECGWAWISPVTHPSNWKSRGDPIKAVRYLAKYLVKSTSEVEVWFAEKKWIRTAHGIIEQKGSEQLMSRVSEASA